MYYVFLISLQIHIPIDFQGGCPPPTLCNLHSRTTPDLTNSYSILFLMAFLPFIFVFLFIITSFSALLFLTFFALQIKSIFFRLLLSLSLSLLQYQRFHAFYSFSFVIFLPCIFDILLILNFILFSFCSKVHIVMKVMLFLSY